MASTRNTRRSRTSLENSRRTSWDGPQDPQNPRNWAKWMQVGNVVIASLLSLIVVLASPVLSPAIELIMRDFHTDNEALGTLTITIYLLGLMIGPLFSAPLSEIYGRLVVYHTSNVAYLATTMGCAVSQKMWVFLLFRFLAGCAGSAPLALGGATVADVIPREERGVAMSILTTALALGPVIGPVIGALTVQHIQWRLVLWGLVALVGFFYGTLRCSGTDLFTKSALVSLAAVVILRETYEKVLLQRRARRVFGTMPKHESQMVIIMQATRRPLRMLLGSAIVSSISIYSAFVFGLLFLLFTTFPTVFQDQYKFSESALGLSYLGLGVGMALGLLLFGFISDRLVKWKTKEDGRVKAEHRLLPLIWFSPTMAIGFFWYGWTAHFKLHWMVPIIGTGFIGFGFGFIFTTTRIYIVDAYGPADSASALAATVVLRSAFGAAFPLVGPILYNSLGLGWGNSVLGFLCLGFTPLPLLLYRYGEKLRTTK